MFWENNNKLYVKAIYKIDCTRVVVIKWYLVSNTIRWNRKVGINFGCVPILYGILNNVFRNYTNIVKSKTNHTDVSLANHLHIPKLTITSKLTLVRVYVCMYCTFLHPLFKLLSLEVKTQHVQKFVIEIRILIQKL